MELEPRLDADNTQKMEKSVADISVCIFYIKNECHLINCSVLMVEQGSSFQLSLLGFYYR